LSDSSANNMQAVSTLCSLRVSNHGDTCAWERGSRVADQLCTPCGIANKLEVCILRRTIIQFWQGRPRIRGFVLLLVHIFVQRRSKCSALTEVASTGSAPAAAAASAAAPALSYNEFLGETPRGVERDTIWRNRSGIATISKRL
jgi:hypothetical protein